MNEKSTETPVWQYARYTWNLILRESQDDE